MNEEGSAVEATDNQASKGQERILNVAEALFLEQGFAAITLRDIADRLQIRQASLYYHFPEGKEQLYIAMAERLFRRQQSGLERSIGAAGHDIAAQLTAAADWFAGQPAMNLASMMHSDMPALSKEGVARVTKAAYAGVYEPLRRIFADAQRRGETREQSPDVMAGAFLAILDTVHFSGSSPGVPSRASMLNDIISVMLDGLRPRR